MTVHVIKLYDKKNRLQYLCEMNEFQVIFNKKIIRLYYFGNKNIKLSDYHVSIDENIYLDGSEFYQLQVIHQVNYKNTFVLKYINVNTFVLKYINVWEIKNNLNFNDKLDLTSYNLIQTQKDTSNLNELRIYHLNKFPNVKNIIFDDTMCINFIEKYFGRQVLEAYLLLIPGAYRADLFRLCALKIHGGIYADHKVVIIKENLLESIRESGCTYHLTMDRPLIINGENLTPRIIHNCFMYFTKNHILLDKAIKYMVSKIKRKHIKRENQYDFLQFGPMFFNDYIQFAEQDYKRFYVHQDGIHIDKQNNEIVIYTNYKDYIKCTSSCYMKLFYENKIYYDKCTFTDKYIFLESEKDCLRIKRKEIFI